jgi:hypothetical protein
MGEVFDCKVFTKPTKGASWQLQTKGPRQDVLTWLEYNLRKKGGYEAACVFPTTKKSTNRDSPEQLLGILERARDQTVLGNNWHSVLRTGLDHTSGATIEVDAEKFTPKQKKMIRDTYTKWWFATKAGSAVSWMSAEVFKGLLKLFISILAKGIGTFSILLLLFNLVPAEWIPQLKGLVIDLDTLTKSPEFIEAGNATIAGLRAVVPKPTLAGSDFTNSIPVSTADDTGDQENRIQAALSKTKKISAEAYFRESQKIVLELFAATPNFVDPALFGYFVCALLVEDFMVQHNIDDHTILAPDDSNDYRLDFGRSTDEFLGNFAFFVKQKAPALCANMTQPQLSADDIFASEFKPVVYLLFKDIDARTGTAFDNIEPNNVKAWDGNTEDGFKAFTVFSENVTSDAESESESESESSNSESDSRHDGSTSSSDAEDDEGGSQSTPESIADEATQQPPKEPTVGIKIQWRPGQVSVDAFVRIKGAANLEAGEKSSKAKVGKAATPGQANQTAGGKSSKAKVGKAATPGQANQTAGGKSKRSKKKSERSKISVEQADEIKKLLAKTQQFEVETREGEDTIMTVAEYFEDTFPLESAVTEEAQCDEMLGLLDAFGPWALKLRHQMNNMIADGIPQKAFAAHNQNIREVENLVKSTRAKIERKRKSIRDTRIVNLRKTIAGLKGDKVDLANAKKGLEAESKQMEQVVNAKQKRVENVEKQLGKVTEQLASLQSQLEDNKKKVSKKESKKKQAENRAEALRKSNASLEREIKKLDESVPKRVKLQEELSENKADLKAKNRETNEAKKRVAAITKLNTKLSNSITTLKDAKTEVETTAANLKTELAAAKSDLKESTNTLAQKEKRIETLETRIATLDSRLNDQKQANTELQNANKVLNQTAKSDTRERARQEKLIASLKTNLAKAAEKAEEANKALAEAEEEFSDTLSETKKKAKETLGEVTAEKKQVEAELKKANSELRLRGKSSAREKLRLETKIERLEAKLVEETNKVANANAAVRAAREEFAKKIAEVKAEVAAAKGDARTVTADKKRLEKELSKAVGRLERKEKQVAAATQATESKGFIMHIRSGSSPTDILVYAPSSRVADKKLKLSTIIHRVERYGFKKIPGDSVGTVPSESLVLVTRINQSPMLLNTFSGQLLNSDNWGDDNMLAKLVPRSSRFDEAAVAASKIAKYVPLPLRKITDSAIRRYAEYAYPPDFLAYEDQRRAFITNTGATIGVVAAGVVAAGVYVASGVSYKRRTKQIAGDIRLACRNAKVA